MSDFGISGFPNLGKTKIQCPKCKKSEGHILTNKMCASCYVTNRKLFEDHATIQDLFRGTNTRTGIKDISRAHGQLSMSDDPNFELKEIKGDKD